MKKKIVLTGKGATLEDVIKTFKMPKKEVKALTKLLLVRRAK